MSLFLKSLIGAMTVLLIALLSKSKSFYIAGLVPLFPTFAIIAHIIVHADRGAGDLKTTALFGIWSLIPYFAYLLTVYSMSTSYRLSHTLGVATAIWVLIATVLIVVWKRCSL